MSSLKNKVVESVDDEQSLRGVGRYGFAPRDKPIKSCY